MEEERYCNVKSCDTCITGEYEAVVEADNCKSAFPIKNRVSAEYSKALLFSTPLSDHSQTCFTPFVEFYSSVEFPPTFHLNSLPTLTLSSSAWVTVGRGDDAAFPPKRRLRRLSYSVADPGLETTTCRYFSPPYSTF